MASHLLRRFLYLCRLREMEADLAEELEFHRAMKQAELENAGAAPREADAASRRALGNATLAREDARAVWIWRWLDDLSHDVVYAIRTLRRHSSFSVVAVPVRRGVGYGVWRDVRFSSAFTRRIRNHAAQFLGSGVVRAYRAESRGGKGMRIFVHPSAAAKLDSLDLVVLPDREANGNASHEVNYLKKPRRKSKNYLDERMPTKDILLNLEGLREMFPDKRPYYDATLAALRRMRE